MAGRSLNKVVLSGNLTRDPEMRYTANGAAVVSFGIATNREYTPTNATEAVEQVEFHNIVAWAKLAELCSKLIGKGDKVYIEGRLQTREWVDEGSNKKMYRTEIVATEMILLNSKRNTQSGFEEVPSNVTSDPTVEETGNPSQPQDDEIPF